MKYVITGSIGHISKPIVQALVKAGQDVTVITSSNERTGEIEALGAKAKVGSVEDVNFLKEAFKGADAVYTMVPPKNATSGWKKHIASVGANYAAAIKDAGVKYVVNLSSIGAHLPAGCGPVSGLHGVEQALNSLEGVNVLHLRPGFFFYNFYALTGMIKHAGIAGGNYGEGTKIILADTNDIADIASDALLNLKFSGKSTKYIASDERTTDEVASVLGKAIDRPDLKWIPFTDEQNVDGMVQAGLPRELAENYTEMGAAMRSGIMFEDYYNTSQRPVGRVKLEDFAKQFSYAFKQPEAVS